MRETLFIVGAAVELLGIVLVASPDLVPGAVRLARWTRPRWRPIENRVRRFVGLTPRGRVVELSATISGAGRVSASGVVGRDPNTSIESKVEYLLRRDQASQEAANRLTQRVEALEAESAKRIDDLRREIDARIVREIEEAQEDYRRARIGGTFALAIGLALVTFANFV